MGDISKYFNRRELCCSHCGKLEYNERLIGMLDNFRAHIRRPLRLNSFYRCRQYQDILIQKGLTTARNSYHLYGMAADIVADHLDPLHVYSYFDNLDGFLGGLGLYLPSGNKHFGFVNFGFVHVDVRHYDARWCKYWDKRKKSNIYSKDVDKAKSQLIYLRQQGYYDKIYLDNDKIKEGLENEKQFKI